MPRWLKPTENSKTVSHTTSTMTCNCEVRHCVQAQIKKYQLSQYAASCTGADGWTNCYNVELIIILHGTTTR